MVIIGIYMIDIIGICLVYFVLNILFGSVYQIQFFKLCLDTDSLYVIQCDIGDAFI